MLFIFGVVTIYPKSLMHIRSKFTPCTETGKLNNICCIKFTSVRNLHLPRHARNMILFKLVHF